MVLQRKLFLVMKKQNTTVYPLDMVISKKVNATEESFDATQGEDQTTGYTKYTQLPKRKKHFYVHLVKGRRNAALPHDLMMDSKQASFSFAYQQSSSDAKNKPFVRRQDSQNNCL